MECHLPNRDEKIASYLADELSEADKLAFEKHYFECSECFAEIKCVADAVRVIQEEGPQAFPDSTSSAVKSFAAVRDYLAGVIETIRRRPGFAIAVVLIFIIAVSPLIYFQLTRSPSGGEPYAANFEPSPVLESYMGQTLKSSQFVLEAQPANDESFKKPEIEFRWTLQDEHAESAGPLELRILDNKQKLMHSIQVNENRLAFGKELEPGLYYWALLSESEMIYLGRFFVRD
jgi:hypothetical protein